MMPNSLQSNFFALQNSRTQPSSLFGPRPNHPFDTIPGLYGSIPTDQDILALSQPPKQKSGFFKKLLKGTALAGGLVLGGIALKRYFPSAAAQVSSYIPGLLKKPVNFAAGTGIGQKIGQYGEAALIQSEGLIGKLRGQAPNVVPQAQGFFSKAKNYLGGLFGRGV